VHLNANMTRVKVNRLVFSCMLIRGVQNAEYGSRRRQMLAFFIRIQSRI